MQQLDLFVLPHVARRRPLEPIARDAKIHPTGLFRWTMQRRWGTGESVGWLMMNPSTADGAKDDPTTHRVMAFAEDWGYRACTVVNLYPFRSAHPKDTMGWRFGEDQAAVRSAMVENHRHAADALADCPIVVAAHGVLDELQAIDLEAWLAVVPIRANRWRCLGLTAAGWPKHPLARGKWRVPNGAPAVPFKPHTPIEAQRREAAAHGGAAA